MSKASEFGVNVYQAMIEVFNEESEYFLGEEITSENANDLFAGIVYAAAFLESKLTGQSVNGLDVIATMNNALFADQLSKTECGAENEDG